MTTTPKVVQPSDTLAAAHSVMSQLGIRHLPVCEGSAAVGVISESDFFHALANAGADPTKMKVSDAMARSVYSVSPNSGIDDVVTEMAKRKLGAAVVVDNSKVVGVFTTTDALQAFAELLHSRLRNT